MTRIGQVLRIDRLNSRVEVRCPPGDALYSARYPDGRPPPPLSTVALEAVGPSWRVASTVSDRELLLHDDFTIVQTPDWGDTTWIRPNAPGTISQTPNVGRGVVNLSTPAVNNSDQILRKSQQAFVLPDGTFNYWCSFKLRVITLTQTVFSIGLLDDARNNGIAYRWSAGAAADVRVANASVDTVTSMPNEVEGQWQAIDLVLDEEQGFGWVDGDGPWPTGGGAPTAAGFQPHIRVNAQAAAIKAVELDWFHVEAFTEPGRPDLASAWDGQESN